MIKHLERTYSLRIVQVEWDFRGCSMDAYTSISFYTDGEASEQVCLFSAKE